MGNFADWVSGKPAIEKRIVHIDLKGPKIPFESFKKFIGILARWGINGVLVEYEHRLPYIPLKNQFPASERYTKSQLKELIAIAADNGIEWIPLVQSFGHVEYLSRLVGTEHLFENPDYPKQLCPLKRQVKKYLENLINIVCELHPESRYIHVGQDETFQLGFCPECREMVRKKGKIGFYLEHTGYVWETVKRYNRIPLFWADMFFTENRLDMLKEIDKGVIPVVWEYNDTDRITHEVSVGGNKPVISDARNKFKAEEQIPVSRLEKDANYFEDLEKRVRDMIGTDGKTGYPKSFPQTRIMSKFNRNFWVACAVYNCSDMLFSPSFIRGVLNPVMMIEIAKKLKIKGVIATNWARAHSFAPISPPWTLSIYNTAYFASCAYSGKTDSHHLKEISKVVAREIGIPAEFGRFSLDDIFWVISSSAPGPGFIRRIGYLENVLSIIKKRALKGIFGKALAISVEAELLWTKLMFLQEEARWWTPMKDEIPSVIKKEMLERFRIIEKDIKILEKKAAGYYTENVGDRKSFSTWWKGLFQLDLFLTEKAIRFLIQK